MRRDLGFYIEAPIEQVYNAYLQAATHPPFSRSCRQEPFHTISFGMNFSFKYNMNGGSCTLHFMPYGSGTALNIRFSIVQGAGARYGLYAKNLNLSMQNYLPCIPQPANYNINDFLQPENRVTPSGVAPSPNPQVFEAPVIPHTMLCCHCGNPLPFGSRFCVHCGVAVETNQKRCQNCNSLVSNNAAFCGKCGTRLQ